MKLADFIEANIEPILLQWVEFAGSLATPWATMDDPALRDDAAKILAGIVTSMRLPQDAAAQKNKSRELTDSEPDALEAATKHAQQRARHGFKTTQLVAEYRALRASVLRLWDDSTRRVEPADLAEVTRFNEALDEALADSLSYFAKELELARHLFMGVLGHDMRGPL